MLMPTIVLLGIAVLVALAATLMNGPRPSITPRRAAGMLYGASLGLAAFVVWAWEYDAVGAFIALIAVALAVFSGHERPARP
jgi:hypothetical protein